jgi:hypothetical protein
MTDTLLFSTTRISTFHGSQPLTAATGFFFERGDALYLVTSRHVLYDTGTGHFPDGVQIMLHTDPTNLTRFSALWLPLYDNGVATWRQGSDSGGEVDVAVLPVPRDQLPPGTVVSPFSERHLQGDFGAVSLGAPLLVVGFPLSFYDTVHHLPVARHAIVASSFGVRFQARGYFLTDGRLHRGASGAPVVMRDESLAPMPWRLLGVHSARMDMSNRDAQDEVLGLNSAWYADILLHLTSDAAPSNG